MNIMIIIPPADTRKDVGYQREGTKRIKESLERGKIKVNMKFWRELSGLVGREIQCIESLTSYLRTLQEKIS